MSTLSNGSGLSGWFLLCYLGFGVEFIFENMILEHAIRHCRMYEYALNMSFGGILVEYSTRLHKLFE